MYAYASSTATRQQNKSMTPRKSPTALYCQDFAGYTSYNSNVYYSGVHQNWQGQISFYFKETNEYRRKKFGGRSQEKVEQKIKDFIEKVPKEKQPDSGSVDQIDSSAQAKQQKKQNKEKGEKKMGKGTLITAEEVRKVKLLGETGLSARQITDILDGRPAYSTNIKILKGKYNKLPEADHSNQERQEVAPEVAEEVPAEQEIIETRSTTGTFAEEQEPETPRIFPETETAEEIEGMIEEEKLMAQAIRYAIENLSKDIRKNPDIDVIKSDADAIKTLAEAYDTIRRRTI